jgi:hypothetical protein
MLLSNFYTDGLASFFTNFGTIRFKVTKTIHTVIVNTDIYNDVIESNGNNNTNGCYSIIFLPNLLIDSLLLTESNDSIRINCHIQNNGFTAISDTFYIDVYLCNNKIAKFYNNNLQIGNYIEIDFKYPKIIDTNIINIVVDTEDDLEELFEYDNFYYDAIIVDITNNIAENNDNDQLIENLKINMFNNNLYINSISKNSFSHFKLIDLKGRTILSKNLSLENRNIFRLSKLPNGKYYLLFFDNRRKYKKAFRELIYIK